MKARSKSVSYAADSSKDFDDELRDDDSDGASDDSKRRSFQVPTTPGKEKSINDPWTTEEQLTLLCQVQRLIPVKDDIPFHVRAEKIDWKRAQVAGRSKKATKSEFQRLIHSTRNFRVLSEIIEEMHGDLLPALNLERPTAAFALFIRENREKIEKYAESLGPKKGAFTHFGAQVFNECSEEERNKYRQRAQEMKEKYKEAIKKFELPKNWRKDSIKRERKLRTNPCKKDTRITPCSMYVKSNLSEDPTHNNAFYRTQYATLPKEEKLEWILRWLGLKKGQKANIEQYLKCKMNLHKQEMDILDEYEGRPRIWTAYNLFIKAHASNSSKNSLKDASKSCAKDWKNLPEKEKADYIAAAKKLRTNFTANFSRFVTSLPADRHDYEISRLNEKSGRQSASDKKSAKEEDDGDDETELQDDSIAPKDGDDDEDNSSYNYVDEDGDELVFQCDTVTTLSRKTNNEDSDSENSNEDDEEALRSKTPRRKAGNMLHSTPYTVVHTTLQSSQTADKPDTPKGNDESKKSSSPRKSTRKKDPPKESAEISKDLTDFREKTNDDNGPNKRAEPLLRAAFRKRNASDSDHTHGKVKPEQFSDSAEDSLASKAQKRKAEQIAQTSAFKKFKDDSVSSEQSVDLKTPTKSGSSVELLKRKFLKLLSNKPPETLLGYYADMSFNGIQKKAKKAFKMLSAADKEDLSNTYERSKEKYTKKFNAFSQILSPQELSQMSAEFAKTTTLAS